MKKKNMMRQFFKRNETSSRGAFNCETVNSSRGGISEPRVNARY